MVVDRAIGQQDIGRLTQEDLAALEIDALELHEIFSLVLLLILSIFYHDQILLTYLKSLYKSMRAFYLSAPPVSCRFFGFLFVNFAFFLYLMTFLRTLAASLL